MDQVCKLVGGCSFVLNTGDNFYECGVQPNDYSRFQSDWIQVYQTAFTPTIRSLPWFNVFGAPAFFCWSKRAKLFMVEIAEYIGPNVVQGADTRACMTAGNHDMVINGAAPDMPMCSGNGLNLCWETILSLHWQHMDQLECLRFIPA